MFDRSKLKGRVIEKYDSQKNFAQAIGSDASRISKILNNESDITAKELLVWADALNITLDEYGKYFFTRNVQ